MQTHTPRPLSYELGLQLTDILGTHLPFTFTYPGWQLTTIFCTDSLGIYLIGAFYWLTA